MIDKHQCSLTFFLEQVKNYDYDLYISLTFLPERFLKPACLLYAFELELQKIFSATKEEMLQRIKLKWWEEALESKNHYNHSLLQEIFLSKELDSFNFADTMRCYEHVMFQEQEPDWSRTNSFAYICGLIDPQFPHHKEAGILYQAYLLTKMSVDLQAATKILINIDLKKISKILAPVFILKPLISWQNQNLQQNNFFKKPNVFKLLYLLYIGYFDFAK